LWLRNKKINECYVLLFLAILTFVVFYPSLKNAFVWDDKGIIFEQIQRIEGFSIYKPSFIYYRPLVAVSFLMDYLCWGYRPFGYHLTNIVLHVFNVLLFYMLSKRLLVRIESGIASNLSFFLTLIFVLHPVHVESVSWIAGRTDLLSCLFCLLTLLAVQLYWPKREKKALILAFIFFFLTVLSKETAISLLIILFIDALFIAPLLYQSRVDKLFVSGLILISGIMIVYGLFKVPALKNYTFQFKPLFLLQAIGFYLKSSILPYPFLSYIPYIPKWGGWISLIFFIVCVIVCWHLYKRKEILKAKIGLNYLLMSFVILSPALGLILFNIGATPLAWRYLYTPSVFFILGLGILSMSFLTRIKAIYLTVVAALITCIFVCIIIPSQYIWKNDLSFWKKAIAVAGTDYAIPQHQYALALLEGSKYKEAEKHFITALRAKDIQAYPWEKAVVYTNLGRLYAIQGKWLWAQRCFKKALLHNPEYKSASCNLGKLYLVLYRRTGDKNLLEKAKAFLKKCQGN